jgi:hypothetical protein
MFLVLDYSHLIRGLAHFTRDTSDILAVRLEQATPAQEWLRGISRCFS